MIRDGTIPGVFVEPLAIDGKPGAEPRQPGGFAGGCCFRLTEQLGRPVHRRQIKPVGAMSLAPGEALLAGPIFKEPHYFAHGRGSAGKTGCLAFRG